MQKYNVYHLKFLNMSLHKIYKRSIKLKVLPNKYKRLLFSIFLSD